MPIPFILGGIALAAAATGVSKGMDAKKKNEKSERKVRNAKRKFEEAQDRLEEERIRLNSELEEFATLKLSVFNQEINTLVEYLNKCKDAKSKFSSENIQFTKEEIRELQTSVSNSLEITSGISKGIASGTLTAVGAYGGVGMLASASTGTAISTLSGAAATNATLAWLGGGSLAAGGGGMALGTAVLGGMVAGPLIAVAGFVMDSKAEKNLTEAEEFKSEVDVAVEKIDYSIEEYNSIYKYVDEMTIIINKFREEFNSVNNRLSSTGLKGIANKLFGSKETCKKKEFQKLLIIGKNLKIVLDIPLMDKDGNKNKNFVNEIKKVTL
jgi:hypothetical protein